MGEKQPFGEAVADGVGTLLYLGLVGVFAGSLGAIAGDGIAHLGIINGANDMVNIIQGLQLNKASIFGAGAGDILAFGSMAANGIRRAVKAHR